MKRSLKVSFLVITFFFNTSIVFSKDFNKEIEVFIEKLPDNEAVVNTRTNSKGKFDFSKLEFGEYVLKILVKEDLVYQKELKKSKKKNNRLKNRENAFFNFEKQIMYCSTTAGCFRIKVSGLKNINKEKIKFFYENEILGTRELITMGTFSVFLKRGKFKCYVKSISLNKFLKLSKVYS